MKNVQIWLVLVCYTANVYCQQSKFETSKGNETATYFEAIDWYKKLATTHKNIIVLQKGLTDAGYPLHVVLLSANANFLPQQKNKVTILINNGIHPGEPDGIDASMLFARDIVTKKITLPTNIMVAIIPVYNIGGCLNRNAYSRVNQNGPIEYGFRGNAQNLDLNRDFIKSDSREAQSFAKIFHWLQPHILIDNHVSDGADYQYTITMLTTQYNKLGNEMGQWLKEKFEPSLYKSMQQKKWEMTPYVNFETDNIETGLHMFYDPPRYSSGYAALFNTIGFVPETHMLKPYKDRVAATYAFMQTMMEQANIYATTIVQQRITAQQQLIQQATFALTWKIDTTTHTTIQFKGYNQAFKTSDATGLQQMYYNHQMPFEKPVKFYNTYIPANNITAPLAYIIPQGWYSVIQLMQLNGVQYYQLKKDTIITVETYKIESYKSYSTPYEKHHKNYAVQTSTQLQPIQFLKGDYYIATNQLAKRYIVETLEPTGEDGFFAWNFFDAILQQKEGYSDYRWDEVAAAYLKKDTALQQQLLLKKQTDTTFANNAAAQLAYIYQHSPYYEPVYLRYPVFRLIQ